MPPREIDVSPHSSGGHPGPPLLLARLARATLPGWPSPSKWLPAHSMLACGSRRGLGTVSSVGNKKRMTGSSFLPTPPRPSPVGEGAQERYLTKPAMRAMLFTQERGPPSRMNFSTVQRGGWASFFCSLAHCTRMIPGCQDVCQGVQQGHSFIFVVQ